MSTFVADLRLKVLGSGSAMPGPAVDNDTMLAALGRHCGRRAERKARAIAHRLAIHQRHLSRDLDQAEGTLQAGQDAPALCHRALGRALEQAGDGADRLGYLVGHTTSPHTLLPPNIAWVADAMAYQGPYLELRQACTGFANALQVAGAFVNANGMDAVALVGSENGSVFFSMDEAFVTAGQLVNYMQMGDGAGALVIGPDDGSGEQLISDMFIGQIGNGVEPGIALDGGGSASPYCDQGLPVFEHRADTVRQKGHHLFERGLAAVRERGYRLDDFRYIVPHQANGRLGQLLARHLGIPEQRFHITADRYGNLGSAAIWVAFDDLRRSGKLAAGDRVLVLGAEASKFLYGGFIYTH